VWGWWVFFGVLVWGGGGGVGLFGVFGWGFCSSVKRETSVGGGGCLPAGSKKKRKRTSSSAFSIQRERERNVRGQETDK